MLAGPDYIVSTWTRYLLKKHSSESDWRIFGNLKKFNYVLPQGSQISSRNSGLKSRCQTVSHSLSFGSYILAVSLGVATAIMEAEGMPISNHLGTLHKDGRLQKQLLQNGQYGLSCECESIFSILNGPFSVDVMLLTFFFICSVTKCQRCLSSVSEKKTFERANLNF